MSDEKPVQKNKNDVLKGVDNHPKKTKNAAVKNQAAENSHAKNSNPSDAKNVSVSAQSKKHMNSPMSFAFFEENEGLIQTILEKYPAARRQSAMLPLLDLAQRQNGGWLSMPALEAVANVLGVGVLKVWEVASFYTMFHLNPVGKYHVQVCGTTPCMLRGAESVKAACHAYLGVGDKAITLDGLFSMEEVECLGACVNAPVVQINDALFEDLDEVSMMHLLKTCREKGLPNAYSARGRISSAPMEENAPLNKTRLLKEKSSALPYASTAASSKSLKEKTSSAKEKNSPSKKEDA